MTLFLVLPVKEDICELIIRNPPSEFKVKLRDTDLQRLKAEISNYEKVCKHNRKGKCGIKIDNNCDNFICDKCHMGLLRCKNEH